MGNRIRLTVLLLLLIVSVVLFSHYLAAADDVEIEMALYSGNSWGVPQNFAYAIYDKAVELFESRPENRHITIKLKTGIMYNHYSEWLAQLVLQGKEPDIFLLVEQDFNTYASIGLLQNLEPFISRCSDFNKQEYYPRGLEAGMFNGIQYSLPISLVPSFMIVNKTLLEDNQIRIDREDWDWDQFYAICRQLTKDLDGDSIPDQFGVYGYDWHNAFYTNDRYLFNPDDPAIQFNSRRLEETLQFLKKMNRLNKGHILREKDFDQGKTGFKVFNLSEYKVYGTYPYRILRYENFEWETIPFPSGPSGTSSSKLYTVQVGMSSRSHHKKEAFSFIRFMTGDREFQEAVWSGTNMLPANRRVVNDLYHASSDEERKILNYPFLNNIIRDSYIDPNFKWYASMDEFIDQKIFQIVAQDLDTSIGIKELREDMEKMLKGYR